ncbi:MAG TPA: PAS domain S-box protein [Vicinamibacteria bacterium]|nr:PAS domain S-box protein [Vicinamibacteria bacterium]
MAASRLWDAEEVRRAMFERLDHHVFLCEQDAGGVLRILDVNGAALAAYGYTREELLGQPLSVIDAETPPEIVRARLRRLDTDRPLLMEARWRRKDGSVFDAEVRSILMRAGERRLVLTVGQDISDRKRAEARLAHSHGLMSYIISHARSAIAVHDRDLRYIYVSERYLREYKLSEQDLIGRHHYEVFPDLPQKWRDVHQRALRGEVISAEEDPWPRADGSVEWTRWECRPWYESDGSVGGIVLYTEVITERKRAEEERKALENQLQQAMKMEAVGRLAGGVAHDFNNLLTAIMGNADLALRHLQPGDPQYHRLREINAAAESAAALTRQLLAFSRKQVIEPRVLDVNTLVSRLEKLLRRLIGEDVDLSLDLEAVLPAVRVDAGQFEQVLVNLVVNARDAMPGGGRLSVETKRVALGEEFCAQHGLLRPGDYVALVVSDTGHGMSDEVKRHLFEPFFTTKTRDRGTGLGLATIFGIVKQAGGAIEVRSDLGRGTRFEIVLPAVEAQPEPAATGNAELPRGTGTVLLVEDDAAVRRLARDVLTGIGYQVMEAADGTQALARLEQHVGAVDLLLTDVVMPGMNGRELRDRVLALHPRARVLFASGYTDNIIAHHGSLDPGVEFIAKPYTPGGLARKVRDVLQASSSAR